ncbi:MAG: hypothetical protein Q8P18_29065 [Pseudomonadota bacterium]|nr:hypothetical protein [Pseudomonadota bacterium]
MTWMLFVAMVEAATVEGPLADSSITADLPTAESFGASRDSGSSGSGSNSSTGNSGSSADTGTNFKKGKLWGWTYRPYVAPGGGLTIGNGGTAITGGVDVGIKYWKKKWKGDILAGGSYTSGTNLNGFDVHAGTEFGRREKWWGVSGGLLGFYNGYVGEDAKDPSLDPAFGLDVPVKLILGPKKYYAWGSITPSFLFNEERHVESLPFGDELEWGVGAGVKFKWITAEAGFTSRITTVGVINTPTISVSISGLD